MPPAKSAIQKKQSKSRTAGRLARARLSNHERYIASELIADKVVRSCWFQRAAIIACYLSTADEVATWTIIKRAWDMKKRIFAPVLKKNDFMQFCELTTDTNIRVNHFGLAEPDSDRIIAPRSLDIVITPVVAFDDTGHRVGMGGGYFDRTFSFLRDRRFLFHPKLIGIAFACQRVEEIAPNPWDIPLFATISDAKQDIY